MAGLQECSNQKVGCFFFNIHIYKRFIEDTAGRSHVEKTLYSYLKEDSAIPDTALVLSQKFLCWSIHRFLWQTNLVIRYIYYYQGFLGV